LIALPKEIGEIPRLRELHTQGNRLTVLPPEIGINLAHLVKGYVNYSLSVHRL